MTIRQGDTYLYANREGREPSLLIRARKPFPKGLIPPLINGEPPHELYIKFTWRGRPRAYAFSPEDIQNNPQRFRFLSVGTGKVLYTDEDTGE